MISADSTHLFVLYDDGGTITSVGDINLDEMDRQGLGRLTCSAEGRHFAQLELTDELREAGSHDDIMAHYAINGGPGTDKPTIYRRGEL